MREIKFRAWNGHNMEQPVYDLSKQYGASKTHPYVLMQFTGLYDTDAVSIFEGDVVRWRQGVGYIIMPVIYNEPSTGFFPFSGMTQTATPSADNVQIIGNIYENPELLEMTSDD